MWTHILISGSLWLEGSYVGQSVELWSLMWGIALSHNLLPFKKWWKPLHGYIFQSPLERTKVYSAHLCSTLSGRVYGVWWAPGQAVHTQGLRVLLNLPESWAKCLVIFISHLRDNFWVNVCLGLWPTMPSFWLTACLLIREDAHTLSLWVCVSTLLLIVINALFPCVCSHTWCHISNNKLSTCFYSVCLLETALLSKRDKGWGHFASGL